VDLDHLKTTLGMDVLPAESPQMVIKEVWAHFLAYNLLRALMWEAGERYGVDPLRLSLKGVLPQVLAHREHVGVFAPRTVPFMILSRYCQESSLTRSQTGPAAANRGRENAGQSSTI